MSATAETLDPATFVQSYIVTKYKKEIEAWGKSAIPEELISILKDLRAPKAAFAEISIILAEGILPAIELRHPGDLRPRRALEAAKVYFNKDTEDNAKAVTEAIDHAFKAEAEATGHAESAAAAYAICYAARASCARNIEEASNNAAWTAYYATATFRIKASYDAVEATSAVLNQQHILDVIRKVGRKHFAFLNKAK
jgi:hypothetical protein